MKEVFTVLMIIALSAMAFASLQAIWGKWERRNRKTARLANSISSGVRENTVAKLTDAAITARNLLFKKGSDVDHIAVAGATDLAIGTVNDLGAAAEELKTVNLLGRGSRTKKMVASEAITAFTRVYQAAGGKIAASGTRCVGLALEAASGDTVELEVLDLPFLPAPGGYVLMFSGIRTWAAGAATTEGFAVAGVLATDLVLATPVAVAGAGILQKVVPTADTLTATTSANWANGDKYSYQVWRAA